MNVWELGKLLSSYNIFYYVEPLERETSLGRKQNMVMAHDRYVLHPEENGTIAMWEIRDENTTMYEDLHVSPTIFSSIEEVVTFLVLVQ